MHHPAERKQRHSGAVAPVWRARCRDSARPGVLGAKDVALHEEATAGGAGEVRDAANRAVVLSVRVLELHAHEVSLPEGSRAEVADDRPHAPPVADNHLRARPEKRGRLGGGQRAGNTVIHSDSVSIGDGIQGPGQPEIARGPLSGVSTSTKVKGQPGVSGRMTDSLQALHPASLHTNAPLTPTHVSLTSSSRIPHTPLTWSPSWNGHALRAWCRCCSRDPGAVASTPSGSGRPVAACSM